MKGGGRREGNKGVVDADGRMKTEGWGRTGGERVEEWKSGVVRDGEEGGRGRIKGYQKGIE